LTSAHAARGLATHAVACYGYRDLRISLSDVFPVKEWTLERASGCYR